MKKNRTVLGVNLDQLHQQDLVRSGLAKAEDLERSITHTRPEPKGLCPTEHPLIYTEEQERLRKEAKEGHLGIKFDNGKDKLRWDLLPWREVEKVVKILTFGAEKYADDNWKYVPEPRKRYYAAAMRHLVAWFKGEKLDKETGENHLAHALCCILFLLWRDNEDEINK